MRNALFKLCQPKMGIGTKHLNRVCFPDSRRREKPQLFKVNKHQMRDVILNSDMKNYSHQGLHWFDIFGISENGIINCFFLSEVGKLFIFLQ